MYVQMPKFPATLWEYVRCLDKVSWHKSKKVEVLMGIAMQIGFGVLAGQSALAFEFSDLKPTNIMLDGEASHKFYGMSSGSTVKIFESITESGFGTVKLIDNSTTRVQGQQVSTLDFYVTTPDLTPLSWYVLDKIVPGFHRDVHKQYHARTCRYVLCWSNGRIASDCDPRGLSSLPGRK